MKQIGLCMAVENAAEQLVDCLDDIIDLFSQVEIIDTGSTDNTVELLAQRYGVPASMGTRSEENCYSRCELLNLGFETLKTPWILCLEADERIARDELQTFIAADGDAQGYLTPWRSHLKSGQQTAVIEDCKLSLFKKGYERQGLVHDSMQASFRQEGASAEWYPNLTIERFQKFDSQSLREHQCYGHRLRLAIEKHPHSVGNYWYLGYRQFQLAEHRLALENLHHCLLSQSRLFPVEVLNSAMILLHIYSLARDFIECAYVLAQAASFYQTVQHDFEVKIKYRPDWFEQCGEKIAQRKIIKAQQFAY